MGKQSVTGASFGSGSTRSAPEAAAHLRPSGNDPSRDERDILIAAFEPEFSRSFYRWMRRGGLRRWIFATCHAAYIEGAETGFRAALIMDDELRQSIRDSDTHPEGRDA